jgi:predicted acetylornithine/succinylornithine family transaminase
MTLTADIIALADKHLLQNLSRLPLVMVKGRGAKLWDAEGREYLDFVAGIAVCAFGHCPPFASEILARQADALWHVSNLYYNEPMVRLAETLTRATGLDRAFFCNSGAEANEAAIKMARKYSRDNFGENRFAIVSALGSFHGRTMGAVSATGQAKLHEGFQPMLPGFKFAPYGDFEALREMVDQTVCAVMLETIQGEGGVVTPPEGYFKKVADFCASNKILLILDEIQCGLGRTGYPFAYQREGITPDIVTLGKALGCGYPVGATIAKEAPASALTPGSHSTTIGGAPLAMALSLELVTRILDPAFISGVKERGQRLKTGLEAVKSDHPELVAEVRGLGLLAALALKIPAAEISEALREDGILTVPTAGTALRLVPPLNVDFEEIDALIAALGKVLAAKSRKG